MSADARGIALLAAAAGAGVLQALSIAWPGNGQPQWWLQLVSLAGLVLILERSSSVRRATLAASLFATGWLTATWWWLFISLHTYGGLPAPLAGLAVLGLAAFLGLYYAAAGGVYRWLARGRGFHDVALFAALWSTAELLRVRWFTGFPWGAGGYAHVDGPLAFLAPWIGVHGIGMLAAALAVLVASLLRRDAPGSLRPWIAVVGAAGLLAACNVATQRLQPVETSGPKLTVALLQGNIPQGEKFERGSGIPLALNWYGDALAKSRASLVVTPETAIPMLPKQLPEGYLEAVREQFSSGTRAALVGIPLGSYTQGYTNSMIGLQPGDSSYRYHKHHLVPFGEFIPPLFKWFTRMMNIPLGDFNRGDIGQPSFVWQGERLAPNVCYEDLFGEELGARFRDPALAPTIFVNVSNIGWFGNTVAIDQHLHISRMRALEFERPMIRATNTGPTVIIDRRGRVTHALPRHTRGVLTGEVEGGRRITPYALWVSRTGLWPLWLVGLGVPLFAWARRRRAALYN